MSHWRALADELERKQEGMMKRPATARAIAVAQQAQSPLAPVDMLERAVASGANVEVIERLIAAKERWDASTSRKAYNLAIAAAKAEIPVIVKTQQKTGAGGSYKYEDIGDIARIVDPILSANGLSYHYVSKCSPELVEVGCVVSHHDGHEAEPVWLASKPDTSGSKNPIQAIGSAVTYLQRYTLKLALGIAASKDDDGAGSYGAQASGEPVTDDQAKAILAAADEAGVSAEHIAKKCGVVSVPAIPAVMYDRVMLYLNRKREQGDT